MKLLLLHPLPLDGSVFSAGLQALVGECVAPTLYGAGADVVAWARAALDAVGDGPVVVVGNSIGGSCAIEVARLAPTKVAALVLVGTKPGHRPEPAQRDEALRVLDEDGVDAAWARWWRPLFGPDASNEVVDRARLVAERLGAATIADGVRAFHGRADRNDDLASWAGPVALVDGEHDARCGPNRRLAPQLRRGTHHPVAGVGHYVPLEAPTALEAVTTEVLASLR